MLRQLGIAAASAGIVIGSSTFAFGKPLPLLAIPSTAGTPKHINTGIPTVLFIDRCTEGCPVKPGGNDAAAGQSDIVMAPVTVEAYPFDDDTWNGIMQCLQDVYSPYNITVTDVMPTNGIYDRCVVGGSSDDLGEIPSCGLSDISCTPIENGLSFAFTDSGSDSGGCLRQYADENDNSQVYGMCMVIAQETAHTYGLDHEYMFTDGMSACSDPMSYRSDCGGEKFFRNKYANCSGNDGQPKGECGEACGSLQNSHMKLLQGLGAGTPTTPPPTIALLNPNPAPTSVVDGATFTVSASSVRSVATVTMSLNGYQWVSTPGVGFGPAGQPLASYPLTFPQNVPDGVIDVLITASDDIGLSTSLPVMTVTKGQPCADASTCLNGQMCSAGKCFWTAASGMEGDACTYPQFCLSGECEGETADKMYCTTDCVPGVSDACDTGYDCVASSANASAGFCLPSNADSGGGGGCCSAGGGGAGELAMHGGLAAAVLAILARRRRHAM